MKDKANNVSKGASSKKVKILSTLSYVLLTIAIIFCAIVIFQVATQGYVSFFGYSMFRVVTPSMEPEIPVGTFIISQKVNIEDIREGDIVSFVSKESYLHGSVVTHRVAGIKESNGELCLITRGDANNSVDAYYVTRENLVGKMTFNSEKDGFLVGFYEFVTNKHIFFLIVTIPLMVIAFSLMKNGVKNMNEEIKNIKEEIKRQEAEKLANERNQKEEGGDPPKEND